MWKGSHAFEELKKTRNSVVATFDNRSKHLVGLSLSIYVKRNLFPFISDIQEEKCGVGTHLFNHAMIVSMLVRTPCIGWCLKEKKLKFVPIAHLLPPFLSV